MKKIFNIFILVALLLISIILFLFAYEYRSEQELFYSDYSLSEEELAMIQDGDIIMRHGYGIVSDLIVETLKGPWDVSHCAILWKDSTNNKVRVIHSVSQSLSPYDGVQDQDINTFIRDSQKNSVIVVRYKPPIEKDPSCIRERALYYLEKRYPFDHDFNIFDTTEIYCTELIYRVILDEYNEDILHFPSNTQEDDVDFNVLTDTNHFEIIFNHHLKREKHI